MCAEFEGWRKCGARGVFFKPNLETKRSRFSRAIPAKTLLKALRQKMQLLATMRLRGLSPPMDRARAEPLAATQRHGAAVGLSQSAV